MPLPETSIPRLTKLAYEMLNFDGPDRIVAAACGIPNAKLSEYRLGRLNPSARHLIALAAFFTCNPSDLVGWSEDEIIL